MQPKLLYSDENPNFHRQIGCVAGIFHAFSRHRLHPSRRLTNLPHRPSSLGAPTHLEENYSEAASDADLIQEDEVREASVAAAGEDTRRPAGVVAKLMGLESLPEIPPGISPEKMKSELRRGAPARLPVERAPWNRHVSVYSEVESKLKDLNLDQSNRDLRALKHILRSMQSKVNDEEDSKLPLGDLSGIKVNAKSTEEKSQREKNHRKAPLPGKSTGKGRQRRLSEVNAELGKKNLGEDFPAEIAAISVDQPSPVSVLDVSFPGDDRPFSPVSKKTDSFRGIEQEHNLPLRAFTAAIQKKFKSIENLLDKLSTLGCNGDVDHIAFLCEKQTPDYRYVSEVLLASGFLLTDLQLHRSSDLPLNPDLFLVLEQTRSRDRFLGEPKHRNPNSAKIRRRLLFDALNEILVRKIDDSDSSRIASEEDHLPARKLLREICSEIETLESYLGIEEILREEVARQWRWWIGGGREIDIVVLEIERHIFKSLIDEVLAGGCVFSASGNPNRRRRRLFHPVK